MIIFITSNCFESKDSTDLVNQIIISREDSLLSAKRDRIIKTDSSVTFPPQGYYTGFNFIIDETSNIYFHNKWINCWHEEYEENPPFMNLKESDVVVLSYRDLRTFVDSIYESDPSSWKGVQMVSTVDTVNMISYDALNGQIDLERKFAKVPLRLVTEEEKDALKKVKKRN
ncbi:MAG: hypothetical protein ACKV1O_04930 [Saprospiraceae bacterium]